MICLARGRKPLSDAHHPTTDAAQWERLSRQRKTLWQRVMFRWNRRKLMRSIFYKDGQISQRGIDFLGHLADQAQLGAVGMAEDARAETWRAARQSFVREVMLWLDVSEPDLMILRQGPELKEGEENV